MDRESTGLGGMNCTRELLVLQLATTRSTYKWWQGFEEGSKDKTLGRMCLAQLSRRQCKDWELEWTAMDQAMGATHPCPTGLG